jgi:hypothetical protein
MFRGFPVSLLEVEVSRFAFIQKMILQSVSAFDRWRRRRTDFYLLALASGLCRSVDYGNLQPTTDDR